MKKIYILFAVTLGLLTASCDLDTTPSTSLDPNEAIENINDLNTAVNGIYFLQVSEMPKSIDRYMGVRGSYAGDFTVYSDLLGSDCYPIGGQNAIREVARYQYTKDSDIAKNFYRRFYYSIARINKIFDLMKSNSLKGDDVNAQLGELYALRALFHFDVARMFAKLPSTTTPDDLGIVIAKRLFDDNDTGTRSTISETYKAIVADLDTALQYLPEDAAIKTGRINYWSARALRARIYLYMEENSLALKDAQYVIDNSPYSLYTVSDYTGVWDKEGTSESLFEFATSSISNAQRNSLGFYTHATGYAECAITPSFKDILLSNPADVRSKMIKEEEDEGYNIGFYPQKYPGRNNEIYVNNPKVIRLSEVYLIASEAALKSGEGDPVYYINELRKNRITGYTPVGSVTLDDILMERRFELFAEGHQAWDAWRNKKSVANQFKGEVNYDNYLTVLPIPVSEINISGGKLQQNPNY
ncbi:MAG: RagB/SusD family nutrient uptake outer membrane protein [Dysgonomonas sp.]